MKLPLLPATVTLILDEHHEYTKVAGQPDVMGDPLPDALVWTMKPLTLVQKSDFFPDYIENRAAALAQIARSQFVSVATLEIGDVPFDATDAHWNSIEAGWAWELGRKLWERTFLSEQDRGK